MMYAEFIACYEATGQVNWLKKFIPGLKVVDDIHKPLKFYCGNNPAVCYAHNNKSSGVAKHIAKHIISLEYISIEKMPADPFTKGLPPNVFREHLTDMGLRESHATEEEALGIVLLLQKRRLNAVVGLILAMLWPSHGPSCYMTGPGQRPPCSCSTCSFNN